MHTRNYFYNVILLLLLASCGGGNNGPNNSLPIIKYNAPSEVLENTSVTLSSISNDQDGFITSHSWSQKSGPLVSLTKISDSSVMFLSPEIDKDTDLIFQLTITDNSGGNVTSNDINIRILNSEADEADILSSDIILNETDSPHSINVEIPNAIENLKSVSYFIKSKPESVAEEFSITFLKSFFNNSNKIEIPIIGLYENYLNSIDFVFNFNDNSKKIITKQYQTLSNNLTSYIQTISPPNNELRPSFNYFYLKQFEGPMLIDIDGNIRWRASNASWSIYFDDFSNKFYFGSGYQFGSLELDGEVSLNDIKSPDLFELDVHHEVSKGKEGHLVEVNASYSINSETRIIESILIEVDDLGNQINIWDMGKIFKNYMLDKGDDPSNFVIDGEDWCHMNSSIYSSQDNSLLISCREDFVAKIDYTSKNIIWLLGDETKHWYQNFPSLRELSINSLDTKPIGQHSLSIYKGNLSLFNNGLNSMRQPDNAPIGINLDTSRATVYEIDEMNKSAKAIFDYTDNIYSDICSSFYSDKYNVDGDFLILYTAVNRRNNDEEWHSLIRGLNSNKQILFELKIPKERGVNMPCRDGWNAQIFNSSLVIR